MNYWQTYTHHFTVETTSIPMLQKLTNTCAFEKTGAISPGLTPKVKLNVREIIFSRTNFIVELIKTCKALLIVILFELWVEALVYGKWIVEFVVRESGRAGRGRTCAMRRDLLIDLFIASNQCPFTLQGGGGGGRPKRGRLWGGGAHGHLLILFHVISRIPCCSAYSLPCWRWRVVSTF